MTHTEIDALTEEQVHDELLKRIGWTIQPHQNGKSHKIKLWKNPAGKWAMKPPLDDNLMREARKLLNTPTLQRNFMFYLKGYGPETVFHEFVLLDISALDQARAILKTLEGRE